MHLVVLLLYRHSQNWNSISSQNFFCLTKPLLSPVYSFPFFEGIAPKHDAWGSAEHGACVVTGLLMWISEFELDNLIIIQVLTAKVACQGKYTNDTTLSFYLQLFLKTFYHFNFLLLHKLAFEQNIYSLTFYFVPC